MGGACRGQGAGRGLEVQVTQQDRRPCALVVLVGNQRRAVERT